MLVSASPPAALSPSALLSSVCIRSSVCICISISVSNWLVKRPFTGVDVLTACVTLASAYCPRLQWPSAGAAGTEPRQLWSLDRVVKRVEENLRAYLISWALSRQVGSFFPAARWRDGTRLAQINSPRSAIPNRCRRLGATCHRATHWTGPQWSQLTIAVYASVRFGAQIQLQFGQAIQTTGLRSAASRCIGAIEGELIGDLYRLHQQNVLIAGRLMTHITFLAFRLNGQLNCEKVAAHPSSRKSQKHKNCRRAKKSGEKDANKKWNMFSGSCCVGPSNQGWCAKVPQWGRCMSPESLYEMTFKLYWPSFMITSVNLKFLLSKIYH